MKIKEKPIVWLHGEIKTPLRIINICKKRLENKGWKVGSAGDFLGLTQEESAYIELKINLSETLRLLRKKYKLTQVQLAKLIHSSQSRVAKMEVGDPTVSLDLIIRAFLALGATKKEIATAISST